MGLRGKATASSVTAARAPEEGGTLLLILHDPGAVFERTLPRLQFLARRFEGAASGLERLDTPRHRLRSTRHHRQAPRRCRR